jgi:hypothetical protein
LKELKNQREKKKKKKKNSKKPIAKNPCGCLKERENVKEKVYVKEDIIENLEKLLDSLTPIESDASWYGDNGLGF